ncbi:unnamed protein product [Rotaria magnacalcarata]|uniref:Protein fem-1 homolog B n=1 Tax=Rotaria magnacalcarata TaxID=392030 RepID=A0A816TWB1_9BILA|nr:unnamed protein product [Rotaria magnacalcarata]CAF2172963.1 unnamed protein product [Rotaria magnacalcarata]CAF4199434.1 unnamed protein product [Rotaria magnacalcarata]CAF4702644.1 unnamed protein product [Rotaria magnacalcarata]
MEILQRSYSSTERENPSIINELYELVFHNQPDELIFYLQSKANADDGTSTPFLIETVFRERLDIVQFLVENGYVDVNGTVTRDRNKYTSVIVAASLNNTQILTYIIEKDAELDYRTYLHDDTALTTAIKRGHLASVKLLFSAGASCGKVNRFGALH